MPKITKLIANAYDYAYDLSGKKKYSEPKIYDANGDLSKRWYVYFSFRNPETGKLERQPTIDTGIMSYRTLRGRNKAIKRLRETVQLILENGFNPYDETEVIEEAKKYTAPDAIDFILKLKEGQISDSYYRDFKSRLTQFKDWLMNNGWEYRFITSVNEDVVISYLNHVAKKSSASNRNNTRSIISVFYTALVDNKIVTDNFIDKINVMKSTPVRNRTYTVKQESDIFELLEKSYPTLLLFIKFISYNFLRPVEVCRLKIGDIDGISKQLHIKTKTKPVKIKIIPRILFDEIPDLSKFSKNDYLFAMDQIGGKWETEDDNKRNYYSKQFNKVKKEFGLDENYGMYSFRHTFITKLYREFRKDLTIFEAESKLMMITGHATHEALKKYLRDIDAELPDDYSDSIKKANAKKK